MVNATQTNGVYLGDLFFFLSLPVSLILSRKKFLPMPSDRLLGLTRNPSTCLLFRKCKKGEAMTLSKGGRRINEIISSS